MFFHSFFLPHCFSNFPVNGKGQIWNAYEYGTKGEAFISSVDKATSMELQFPSVVYKNGVAKKVIGVGYCDPDKTNPYEAYLASLMAGKAVTLCYIR